MLPPGEVCTGSTRTFLYNVVLDADLNTVANQGDILCLPGNGAPPQPLGNQEAFDQTNGDTFTVVAAQPNQDECSGPSVHATVASGTPFVGQAPLTQVCISIPGP